MLGNGSAVNRVGVPNERRKERGAPCHIHSDSLDETEKRKQFSFGSVPPVFLGSERGAGNLSEILDQDLEGRPVLPHLPLLRSTSHGCGSRLGP